MRFLFTKWINFLSNPYFKPQPPFCMKLCILYCYFIYTNPWFFKSTSKLQTILYVQLNGVKYVFLIHTELWSCFTTSLDLIQISGSYDFCNWVSKWSWLSCLIRICILWCINDYVFYFFQKQLTTDSSVSYSHIMLMFWLLLCIYSHTYSCCISVCRYYAQYEITEARKSCRLFQEWAQPLTKGAIVCVECQQVAMKHKLGVRCQGDGVAHRQTRWHAVTVPGCHGKWEMKEEHVEGKCGGDDKLPFIFVWEATSQGRGGSFFVNFTASILRELPFLFLL